MQFNSEKLQAKSLDVMLDENQLIAITKRTILHTLSVIRDSIDLSNTLKGPLAFIFLNFLEGFDNVDWDFILSVLCKFRYRSKLIHIIPLAYANIQSKSKVNAVLSLSKDFVRVINVIVHH